MLATMSSELIIQTKKLATTYRQMEAEYHRLRYLYGKLSNTTGNNIIISKALWHTSRQLRLTSKELRNLNKPLSP